MCKVCAVFVLVAAILAGPAISASEQTPGPWWHVVDNWEQVDVSLGFGFTSVSATVLVGSVDIPVWSIKSGYWRDPTCWSDLTVYYTRAQSLLDLTDPLGATLIEIDLGTGETTCAFEDFMETGPTNRPITVPIEVDIPYVGSVGVNLGTNAHYDVFVGHHIILNQSPTINSLRIDGGSLDVDDRYSLNILEDTVENKAEIRKTRGDGTFSFPGEIINKGTISASSGTLFLTELDNRGLIQSHTGGTVSIPTGVLEGEVLSNGTIAFRGTDVQTASPLTGSGKYQVAANSNLTIIEGLHVHDTGMEVLGGGTLSTYGTWTNVQTLVDPKNSTSQARIQVPADRELILAGTGRLTLAGDKAKLSTLGGTSRVVHGPSHTIQGWGNLACVLTNQGTINANVNEKTLNVYELDNPGIMKSESGGILAINGAIDGGTIISDSQIHIKNQATITTPIPLTGSGTYYPISEKYVPLLDGGAVRNTSMEIVYDNSLDAWGTWTNVQTLMDTRNPSYKAQIRIPYDRELELAGAGTLTMAGAQAKITTKGGAARLVHGPNHRIQGWGQLACPMVNQGTIVANVNEKTLFQHYNCDNNSGTLRAENGGILSINGAIDGGTIISNSEVHIKNQAVITTPIPLTGSGTFYPISENYIPLLDGTPVSNTSMEIVYDNQLNAWGAWTNVQTLMESRNPSYKAQIRVPADRELELIGAGTLTMAGAQAKLATQGGTSRVVHGPDHTIQGWGYLSCEMRNQGLVTANVNEQTLKVYNIDNNYGTLRAENGGILAINGAIDGGAIVSNSAVQLKNQATITTPVPLTGSGTFYPISENYIPLLDGVAVKNTSMEIVYDNQLNAWGAWTNVQTLMESRNPSYKAQIRVPADRELELAGWGTITMAGAQAKIATQGGTSRVVHGPNHKIQGWGYLSCEMTNQGLVTANVNEQTLSVYNIENTGTLRSENGGILAINGNINGGTIVSDSAVYVQNAASISTSVPLTGSGTYYPISGTQVPLFDGAPVSNTSIEIVYDNQLNAWGAWTNVQTLMESRNSSYNTQIRIPADRELELAGAGTLTMAGAHAKIATQGGTSRVIHGPDHTIQGWGYLSCEMTNQGLITANVNEQTLSVYNIENSGTLRAENGGILAINGAINGGTIVSDSTTRIQHGASISTTVPLTGSGTYYPISSTSVPLLDGAPVKNTSVEITYNNRLNAWGTWTNVQALMEANNPSYQPQLFVPFDRELELAGAGTLTIAGVKAKLATQGGTSRVIHGPDHTIQGWGYLSCEMTNQGLITANVNEQTLNVYNIENSGTLRSENGGILAINGAISGGTVVSDSTTRIQYGASISTSVPLTGSGTYYPISSTSIPLFDGAPVKNTSVEITHNNRLNAWGTWTNVQTLMEANNPSYHPQLFVPFDRELELAGAGTLTIAGVKAKLATQGGTSRVIHGPDHTIQGWGYLSCVMTNQGLISANVNEQILHVYNTENFGTLRAENGGILYVIGNVSGPGNWMADDGTFRVGAVNVESTGSMNLINGSGLSLDGSTVAIQNLYMDETSWLSVASTLSIGGDLKFATDDEDSWSWDDRATLELTGGQDVRPGSWAGWARLEIGGEDLGDVEEGYTDNFDLARLHIADGAHVYLWDMFDNGNRTAAAAEALYVDQLFVGEGAVLNTNGLSLYYKSVSGTGQIDDTIVPEPGTVWMLFCFALVLLSRRAKR